MTRSTASDHHSAHWVVRALLGIAIIFIVCGRSEASTALEQLQANWSELQDYSVTIQAHEVLDGRSEDRDLRYSFRKPAQARLDIVSGNRVTATPLWRGGDRVAAYRPGLASIKVRGSAQAPTFTSLRGNGILTPKLGTILTRFSQNGGAVAESRGPVIGGQPTTEITLERTQRHCTTDSAADLHITRDVLDVAANGAVLMRRRYEGASLVESWLLRDYRVNGGLMTACSANGNGLTTT